MTSQMFKFRLATILMTRDKLGPVESLNIDLNTDCLHLV